VRRRGVGPGVAAEPTVRLGLGRSVALPNRSPLHTRFTNIFGISVFEATMRPNPRYGRVAVVQFADAVRIPMLYVIFWDSTAASGPA
jgi:hypothetical protein